MLKLINTGNRLPTQYYFDHKMQLEPGQIASINLDIGKVICPHFPEARSVGLIDDVRNDGDDSTKNSNRVTVWSGVGLVFETDQYVPGDFTEYKLLYNTGGKLSIQETNEGPIAMFLSFTDNYVSSRKIKAVLLK